MVELTFVEALIRAFWARLDWEPGELMLFLTKSCLGLVALEIAVFICATLRTAPPRELLPLKVLLYMSWLGPMLVKRPDSIGD